MEDGGGEVGADGCGAWNVVSRVGLRCGGVIAGDGIEIFVDGG